MTILKRHDLFKDRVCVGHTEYIKQRSKGIENRREDLSTEDIIIEEMQRL